MFSIIIKPLGSSWNYYKQIKNQTNLAVRQEKRQYLQHTINTNVNNSKIFWRKLHDLDIHSKKKSDSIPEILNNPNDINKHLLNVNKNSSTDKQLNDFYKKNIKDGISSTFFFHTVSDSVVKECLLNIKSVATGVDDLNLDMILLCISRILPFVTNIINSCLLESTFPKSWKISKILPITKKLNIESYNDLKHISILPILSKVIEKIMNL